MVTNANPYVRNVPGNPGFNFMPLLTVGDEVPLIEGTVGNFRTVPGRTFAMTGIPDGMGLFETRDNYYVFLNHEIAAVNSQGNPIFSDISSTVPGRIQGARVSLFVFDKNWNPIGGKNLIERVVDSTGEFVLNTSKGTYVNPANGREFSLTRFCSAYLAESGFVDAKGGSIPVYFIPEETTINSTTGESPSRSWAVLPDGTAIGLDGFGRFARENTISASQYRANNSERTVLFSTEDFSNGEVYMFVGQQTAQDPNGFKDGQLYVLKVDGYDGETLPEGIRTKATWTPVPKDVALDTTGKVLSDWVDASGRSTNFRRPEDISEDPNNPGTFYFVTTGTNDKAGGGKATTAAEAENPYGRMYRFTLNPTDPTAPISNFETVLIGGMDTGVSYDNMVVDHKGQILIQEDETAFGGDVMRARAREAGMWLYDIRTDKVTFVAELDESAAGEQFDNTSEPGQWETSGIVEVGKGRNFYLFDVQAHSITSTKDLKGNHVEGGQLLLAMWQGPDRLTAKGNEVVFGYGGNDSIDASGGTGGNTLYGGQGNDTMIGSTKDLIFGDKGNDLLLAGKACTLNGGLGNDYINASTGAGGNVLYGGQDNDTIIGGSGDRIFGDKGNDVMYAGTGANTLTGGEGKDQFWIVNAVIPTAANTITDFKAGTDVIGINGLGINNSSSLTLTQKGGDVLISYLSKDLAIVNGVQVSVLSNTSFAFG